ncbi:MAG: ComEC/Rec2 family competence protein [Alphaproteobacteria bacterium]
MVTRKYILNLWREGTAGLLLLPIAFIAGIALYFALPVEPHLLPLALAVAMLAVWWWRWRRRGHPTTRTAMAVFLVALGVFWACLYTAQIRHPMLERAMTPRPVTGIIENIEITAKGHRITLAAVTIAGLAPEQTPHRVRLALRGKIPDLQLGDTVRLNAGLLPPMGPALPHSFDFARYFFFRDIGAVGYGLNPITITDKAREGEGWSAMWARWRHQLTENIMATLPLPHGAVAAGLITGEDAAIPEATFDQLRAANLVHIIAISGTHMVMIAAIVFIGLRLLMLLIPGFGLRPHAKQIAAFLTLIVLTGYLLITGLMISAIRAYVMMAMILLALMFDRDVMPMRSLVLAALLMLLFDPSDLLEPGFQLSFVATMAIIAFIGSREAPKLRFHGPTLFTYLFWLMMMSVVAEGATAPLVIHHFNNLAIYGVFANTLLSPVVALVIMPMVALYFLLLPFGIEAVALHIMSYGITAMLKMAEFISGLPHALTFLPSIPGYGVALFVAGLIWLCLLNNRLRLAGILPMVIGVMTLFTVTLPDFLATAELKQIAMRTDSGYVLLRGRAQSLIPELWANGTGSAKLTYNPKAWRCDAVGCVALVRGRRIAVSEQYEALMEDCRLSDFILTRLKDARCSSRTRVFNSYYTQGTIGLFIADDAIRAETSSDWQGNRPWSE